MVVGLIVYALIPRASLVFAVAPEEVTVTINGKEQQVENGQEINVSPGKIELKISRPNFVEHTETLELKNGDRQEVLVALTALNGDAQLLLETPGARMVIERIGGQAVEEGAAKLMEAYPIMKDLPVTDKFFHIVVCDSEKYPGDRSKIAVCIRLYDLQARESAFDEIKRLGYSVDDYEIIVQDYSYESLIEDAGE